MKILVCSMMLKMERGQNAWQENASKRSNQYDSKAAAFFDHLPEARKQTALRKLRKKELTAKKIGLIHGQNKGGKEWKKNVYPIPRSPYLASKGINEGGLAVSKRFVPGELMGLFWGKLMTTKEAADYYGAAASPELRRRSCYHCTIEASELEFLVIDPHELSGKVNHAGEIGRAEFDRDPHENMRWLDIIYRNISYIAEIVTADIEKGGEVLTHYGPKWQLDPHEGDWKQGDEIYKKHHTCDLRDL